MNKMTGWVLSGVFWLGVSALGMAQETKRPAVPQLPVPPAPPTTTRAAVGVPPRFPAAPTAATTPASGAQVIPQPFPTLTTPTTPAFPAASIAAGSPASAGPLTALKFDAERKDYSSKPGELQAPFTFHLTNTSAAEVSITAVRTSCGCTVAKLPSTPWVVPPGQGGPIEVSVNLAGKSGTITKSVTVESSAGVKSLLVTVNIAGGANSPLVA